MLEKINNNLLSQKFCFIFVVVILRIELRRLCAILLVMLTLSQTAVAELQWRETNREVHGKSLVDTRVSDGIEIYGSKGTITIVTPRRIVVRVYTILGQMISQATLSAGTSELHLESRGVYLVKIGSLTQKVAL